HMLGVVGTMANDLLELRLSYMEGLVNRDINGVTVIKDIKQQFIGLSINLSLGNLQVLSEFNNYRRPDNSIEVDTYMLSFGYRLGDFTPHITRSAFEQEVNAAGNDEKHNTTTLGIRWDLYRDIALKVQYDKVIDEGVVVPVKGDSNSVSIGLDFVF
ncbi:MAG: porin, partial [Gammaproteobacteria bacterium]|nr:porin [Gammaproteobacteria bacterium]